MRILLAINILVVSYQKAQSTYAEQNLGKNSLTVGLFCISTHGAMESGFTSVPFHLMHMPRQGYTMRGFYAEDHLYPFFKYDYMLKVGSACMKPKVQCLSKLLTAECLAGLIHIQFMVLRYPWIIHPWQQSFGGHLVLILLPFEHGLSEQEADTLLSDIPVLSEHNEPQATMTDQNC